MVMIDPHPAVCEKCKTAKARLRHRKRQDDGSILERWLCYDCASGVLDDAGEKKKEDSHG